MPFLTDDLVRQLAPPAKANKVYYDQADPDVPATADIVVTGMGIKVTAAGRRTWGLAYRLRDGTALQRWYSIGRFPYLNTSAARKRARKLREEIEQGGDPQGDKTAKRDAPTVGQLADLFETEQTALIKARERRASTLEGYRRLVRLYIRPALGTMKVAAVTKADVKRLHRKITATGKLVQANRVVALLSAMMTFAIGEEYRSDNPCVGAVGFNKELPRARDITPDERGRLTEEVAKHNNPAGNVIKLLLVTGARKSEAMNARWSDLVLGGNKPVWNRKAADQKAGHDHTLVLNRVAAQLLKMIQDETIARDGHLGEYVFLGRDGKHRIVEIRKTWLAILKGAGIADLHIHDLRHHFASELASSGASLPLIGSLLGHRSASSTHRYARLFPDAQREASDRAGAAIAGTDTDNVVPMKRA
jgi:integrase